MFLEILFGVITLTLLLSVKSQRHNVLQIFAAFEDLTIEADSYLINVANHRKFARKMELKDFFQSPVRGTWNDFSHMANIATVNAYYNQATNTMVVPIGMLQPPLFWSRPKSLTFGAFGIVVGKIHFSQL